MRAFHSAGPSVRCFSVHDLERAVLASGTTAETAAALGTTARNLLRLRSMGLTWAQADVYAVRVGLHPGEVWPDWFAG